MRHPFLVGKKLYLRALEAEDLEGDYFDWLNDKEVTRYMESGIFPNTREKMKSFLKLAQDPHENVIFAIVGKKTDKHIGNIRLGPISWVHRVSNFGIMIGDKKFWGKGYGSEATRLILRHGFERLNLHKVSLGVAADHKSAVASYKRVGFKVEGRAREQFCLDGKYHDCLYMGILRREFRDGR